MEHKELSRPLRSNNDIMTKKQNKVSSKVEGYKYVYYRKFDRGRLSEKPYNGRFTINGQVTDVGWYAEVRDCAKAVDLALIRLKRDPVNIYKKKV